MAKGRRPKSDPFARSKDEFLLRTEVNGSSSRVRAKFNGDRLALVQAQSMAKRMSAPAVITVERQPLIGGRVATPIYRVTRAEDGVVWTKILSNED